MFLGITGHISRTLARGVAVCVVGGVVVGCGSAANLTDGLVTNSTVPQTNYAPNDQPYPGDVTYSTRRSAGRSGMKIVRPKAAVGGGVVQNRAVTNLPSPSAASRPSYAASAPIQRSTVTTQPLPAPQQVASAASAVQSAPAQVAASVDNRATGSIARTVSSAPAAAAAPSLLPQAPLRRRLRSPKAIRFTAWHAGLMFPLPPS